MRRILATVFVCALLLLAGCSGTPDATENGTEATTMNGTTVQETTAGNGNESTATTEPGESNATSPTDANFSFRPAEAGQVKVVHMGGSEITNESTESGVVSVGDNNTTWVSDDANETAQSYPISVGNLITVNATAGDTIEVHWTGEDGTTESLATYEVEAGNATTTAAGNGSGSNATTTTTTAES
jgi:hypothetical protein